MARLYACEPMTTSERIDAFCSCSLDALSQTPYTITDIIDAASDMVVTITNGRVKGRCTTTVRPCADMGCVCGLPSDGCSCCRVSEIRLPGEAIVIGQVIIDGVVQDPNSYGWLDGAGLVRIGADHPRWPGCQNLQILDLSQDNTFGITYTYGILPFVAVMTATELACDLLLGVTRKTSRLDPQVISAVMDSVTIEFDPEMLGLFDWTKRLVGQYPLRPEPFVWSPEVDDGYALHTLRPVT